MAVSDKIRCTGLDAEDVATGNQKWFSQDSEIKLDERWRKEPSSPMLRLFERHAGEVNKQLGYCD